MTYWKADGVAMPTPDTCSITEYDLDSAATGRPESGILYRERIRDNLGSYSMTFSRLSVPDAKKFVMPSCLPRLKSRCGFLESTSRVRCTLATERMKKNLPKMERNMFR